jgi:hypothetical protein
VLRAVALINQLTFHPAFDPFHAVFRSLRLRRVIAQHGPLHRDHVRILDFYLLFPFRIEGIRLTPQHRKYRKLAQDYEQKKPYGDQPEDKNVFTRMELMQLAALDTLANRNFIAADRWALGEVAATPISLPAPLTPRIEEINAAEADLVAFLEVLASEYEFLGPHGLKNRTSLLESRYDAI